MDILSKRLFFIFLPNKNPIRVQHCLALSFQWMLFFLFYHQIKSKRNPREQRDKRKIASSVPIGWTQFTFSSQNVCWNGLALLTQHSLLFLISTISLDDKANFYLFNLRIHVRSAFPALNWTCESYYPCGQGFHIM